jgi:hypothetical protein
LSAKTTVAQGGEHEFFFFPYGKLLFVWSMLGKAYEGTLNKLLPAIGSSDWPRKSRVGFCHALVNMAKKLPSLLP